MDAQAEVVHGHPAGRKNSDSHANLCMNVPTPLNCLQGL